MKLSTTLLAVAILASGCGGGNAPQAKVSPTSLAIPSETPSPSQSPSPSPSPSPDITPSASPVVQPSPSPVPVAGAFGVLAGPLIGNTYTVSLVATDGRVVASAQASPPMSLFCSNGAAASLQVPVSTSNSRAYFMDSSGVVRFLSPDGSIGRVTSLPILGAARRSFFAVSPDDKRIAVAVVDFAAGASTRLYVEDLYNGGHHLDIYSETGSYTLWPIGWHGTGNLVVAKVLACSPGGGPFCCGPLELHVVDPATGLRRFTLGGSGCVVVGAPSPAGVACENSSFAQVNEINWTAGVFNSFPIQGPAPAYVSPDGNGLAVVRNGQTDVLVGSSLQMQACGWIDSSHLLAGGDPQQQARVGDVLRNAVAPVAALGDCAGRIPGGL